MRVHDCNWQMLEAYLAHDDRIVLPIGSTEQHGYLSVGTDAILAERVAVEAAEPLGVPVLPALPFGVTPYFAAFPGSPSLRTSTYISVIRDLLGVRQIGPVAIDAMDLRAILLEPVRDRSADPMRRPGDERDLAAQLTHSCSTRSR